MKQFITFLLCYILLFPVVTFASMNYECWRYKNGKPDAYTNITANSKSEAESKGCAMDGKYCKCH